MALNVTRVLIDHVFSYVVVWAHPPITTLSKYFHITSNSYPKEYRLQNAHHVASPLMLYTVCRLQCSVLQYFRNHKLQNILPIRFFHPSLQQVFDNCQPFALPQQLFSSNVLFLPLMLTHSHFCSPNPCDFRNKNIFLLQLNQFLNGIRMKCLCCCILCQ